MKTYFKITRLLIAGLLAILLINTGCKKQALQYTTTPDVNIVDYLREYPAKYSEFVKILDRTNISSYLNAYGAYTCFAPTNDAFKLYLKQIGKTSTDDLDTTTLKNIIRLHLIQDTLSTPTFTDGKLRTPTMYGQYLITGFTTANGVGGIIVNRQAIITQSNILTGNGLIHELDHVLQPAALTVAATVAANPKYSIFTQALKATGLYDTLNINNNPDSTRRWLTLIAESDSVLKNAGFNTYSDLVKKYNNTGNPKNPSDSLFLYVAYHILTGINYLADIVSAPSHPTLAPLNIISSTLSGDSIILNRTVFNNVLEFGVLMNRPNSDISCTNGVLHDVFTDFYIKVRTPTALYWDLGDQPEIRKLTSVFRVAGKSNIFAYGALAGVTWQVTAATFTYSVEAAASTNYYYWDDGVSFPLRGNGGVTNGWIEFTTPLIVAGKYKVWLCVRRANMGKYVQTTVDGQILSRIVDFTTSPIFANPNTQSNDAVNEAAGYKHYDSTNASNGNQFAVLAGIATIATTDYHKIRLTCIKDYGSNGSNPNQTTMDMIEFIPVDQDQQYPRFKRDGTAQTVAHY